MSKIYTKLNFLVFGIVILLFILKTFIFKKKVNTIDKLSENNKIREKKNSNHNHTLKDYDGISSLWKDTFFAWSDRWESLKPFPEFVKILKEHSRYSRLLLSSKVLEVGCGSGNLTNYLYDNGVDIIGCDVSTDAIITAQAKSSDKNLKFKICDVLNINNFKEKYDVIIECSLLQNMNNVERSKYINNLKKIVNKNGLIISLNVNENNDYEHGPPNPLSQSDYKSIFTMLDWRILEFRETKYLTKKRDFNAWFVLITLSESNL
jgi:2-polyprenyl-3-methyl-5-hydroxy-6-metoxy-1,4-benzoquinol methylase